MGSYSRVIISRHKDSSALLAYLINCIIMYHFWDYVYYFFEKFVQDRFVHTYITV